MTTDNTKTKATPENLVAAIAALAEADAALVQADAAYVQAANDGDKTAQRKAEAAGEEALAARWKAMDAFTLEYLAEALIRRGVR